MAEEQPLWDVQMLKLEDNFVHTQELLLFAMRAIALSMSIPQEMLVNKSDPYAELLKDFISKFNQQIAQDALTEIKAKLPGHSEPFYNDILNKAQTVARASGNKSTYDVVLSKEFWEQL